MKNYSVILIGAGGRGAAYTDLMKKCSDKFKVVAVAETTKARRDEIKHKHNIPDDMCFDTWEDVLSKPKFADIVLICTSDNMHYKPAMKAIEKGYDILLEKPVAQTAQECVDIALAVASANPGKRRGKIGICNGIPAAFRQIEIRRQIDADIAVLALHHFGVLLAVFRHDPFVAESHASGDQVE